MNPQIGPWHICLLILGLVSASASAIPSGAIVNYTFSGNANDTSGNGGNLTVNGAVLTADRFGTANSAYFFDGIDDSMSATVPALPLGASARTVSLWEKVVGLNTSVTRWAFNYGPEAELKPYGLATSQSFYQWGIATYGGGNGLSSGIAVNEDWHHIVTIFTGSEHKLYIDNVLVATRAETIDTVMSELRIGWGLGALNWSGVLDDITIYDRALSQNEIQSLFKDVPAINQNVPDSGKFGFYFLWLVLTLMGIHKRGSPASCR